MAIPEVVTAVAGFVGGGGFLKLLEWYAKREEQVAAHKSAAELDKTALLQSERTTIVELLKANAEEAKARATQAELSGDQRAERSAERAAAITRALEASTEAHRETAQALKEFSHLVATQNDRLEHIVKLLTEKLH